jgi:hypothetical protein
MAVSLKVGVEAIEPSAPRELFQLPVRSSSAGAVYQPGLDGQRFLVLTSPENVPQSLTAFINWRLCSRRERRLLTGRWNIDWLRAERSRRRAGNAVSIRQTSDSGIYYPNRSFPISALLWYRSLRLRAARIRAAAIVLQRIGQRNQPRSCRSQPRGTALSGQPRTAQPYLKPTQPSHKSDPCQQRLILVVLISELQHRGRRSHSPAAPPGQYARHIGVDHGSQVQGHQLGDHQAADHAESQRAARLASGAIA